MATEEGKVDPEAQPPDNGKPNSEEQPPSNAKSSPEEQKGALEKSIAIAQRVVQAQKSAAGLKERAKKAANPKERFKLLEEAYKKEVEAVGQSKYAKRMQSGVWQGGTAGGGIGAGVAMGVGAVTGTLVSGLVAVPTVLLGGLTGAGVGAIKGPFVKLGGGGGGDDKKGKPMTEEAIRAQAMKEAEALDQAVETGANTVPQPPKLEEGESDENSSSRPAQPYAGSVVSDSPRKKPRKLEVRSANQSQPSPQRKKPRKLEVRAGAQKTASA